MILGAEFLSIILIIVMLEQSQYYLYLLYDVKFTYNGGIYTIVTYLPIGAFIGLFFFLEIFYMIKIDFG